MALSDADKQLFEEAKQLRAKKRFSQNFLIRDKVHRVIADSLNLTQDETVVEIGPGSGFLTRYLVPPCGHLVGIEVERSMVKHLEVMFEGDPKVTLFAEDFLKFDFDRIEAERFKVVGNLPYAISSPIIFKLIGELNDVDHKDRHRIDAITVMVQREVGERLTAKPGVKAFNHLSIAAQFYFDTELLIVAPPGDFYPSPNVDSAVVRFVPKAKPAADVADMALFASLVRLSFGQRRKTLRNNLKNIKTHRLASIEVFDTILEELSIDGMLRPDQLSIEQYAGIANALYQNTSKN